MGKKKVVLDTNILVSAFGWDGKPKEILRRILRGEFELYMSKKQLEEITRVIDYPKFEFTDDQKSKFVAIITELATITETNTSLDIIKEDPSDNAILESDIESKADYIISGDDHLLKLESYHNIKIVTATQFLELL